MRASDLINGALPILYTGVLSVGVAYTLQVVGQRDTPPSQAAIILSLETVVAALGGWLLLSETLSPRGVIGCALMFVGMVVSQLDMRTQGGRDSKNHKRRIRRAFANDC
jgi:drug/metabolite transporter (DMT)-like permease